MSTYDDFQNIDIRVGVIIGVDEFPQARTPAYKLTIDFGKDIGIKKSSAQLTQNYPRKEKLIGKKVLGVVNFPARQIGPFVSEVLTLGVPDGAHACILIVPDSEHAIIGGKLY